MSAQTKHLFACLFHVLAILSTYKNCPFKFFCDFEFTKHAIFFVVRSFVVVLLTGDVKLHGQIRLISPCVNKFAHATKIYP